MVGAVSIASANPSDITQFEHRGFSPWSSRHTVTETWRWSVVGSNPFTRVCWADLNWPTEDVSCGPSQLGRSVSVRDVRGSAWTNMASRPRSMLPITEASMMRVREGVELISSSHGRRYVWRSAYLRLYSRHIAIGVRRDLNVPHDPGPAKIPLTVRQLQPGDDLSLIADVPGLGRV